MPPEPADGALNLEASGGSATAVGGQVELSVATAKLRLRRVTPRPRGAGRPARRPRPRSRAGPDDDPGESSEPPRPGACPNQRLEAVPSHPSARKEWW
jgi:hypothetical protein